MVGFKAQNRVIAHQDFEQDLTNDGQSEKNKTSQKSQQNSLIKDTKYLCISILIYPFGIIDGESDGPGCESWLSTLGNLFQVSKPHFTHL